VAEFIVFGRPVIGPAEIDEVVATLKSGWLGAGPRVARFEEDFARYKGLSPPRVAAVSSCSAALHLSLIAAGIGRGDEVITTPMTFCATVNAILHTGATPVLADVEPDTLNIDPSEIRKKISPRTRAIVPVHLAGLPCEMDSILAIAEEHDLMVVEDCAHAIETEYRGRPAGTMGDFGAFSFYPSKNMTSGEGGMVVARDSAQIEKIKSCSHNGLSRDAWKRFSDSAFNHYVVDDCGYKYNMTDLQAAIGIHQLDRLENHWLKRRSIWFAYREKLAGLPVQHPADPAEGDRHGFHLYSVLLSEAFARSVGRDRLMSNLQERGIGTGVHYLALPEHPYYQRELSWKPQDTPVATSAGRRTLSLPLSADLNCEEIERIVGALLSELG
jgi:dTDP-4-amino-4,6-dideoxygalactose transaminase